MVHELSRMYWLLSPLSCQKKEDNMCFRKFPVKSSFWLKTDVFVVDGAVRHRHLAYAFGPCKLYLIRRAETVGSSECRRSS